MFASHRNGRSAGAVRLVGEPSARSAVVGPQRSPRPGKLVDRRGRARLGRLRGTRSLVGYSRIRLEPLGVARLLARPLPRWKRLADVVGSAFGLVLLSPLMLAIAVLLKLTSREPVIFRHTRTGIGMRRFTLYKFRTMRSDPGLGWEQLGGVNEMSGPLFKSSRDPRVTRIGRFLRRTSLDELPQLWNVLRGDMTFIGPRALSPLPREYETWQLRRFDVTPGLACTWQATRRAETDFVAWMRSDLRYVDQGSSMRGDARLLASTIAAVLRCAGGR